jgi:cysteinyl-tRNA synthetase
MELIIDIRKSARDNKDWNTSDKIRDTLANAGIEVKDGKNGSTWKI